MSIFSRLPAYIKKKRLTRDLADLVSQSEDLSAPAVLAHARELLAAGANPNGKLFASEPLVWTGKYYGRTARRSIFSRTLLCGNMCRLMVEYGACLDKDTIEEAINLINEPNRFSDIDLIRSVSHEVMAVLLEIARAPVGRANMDKRYPDMTRRGYVEEDYLRPAIDIFKDRVPGFGEAFGIHQLQNQLEEATPPAQTSAKPRSQRL